MIPELTRSRCRMRIKNAVPFATCQVALQKGLRGAAAAVARCEHLAQLASGGPSLRGCSEELARATMLGGKCVA